MRDIVAKENKTRLYFVGHENTHTSDFIGHRSAAGDGCTATAARYSPAAHKSKR